MNGRGGEVDMIPLELKFAIEAGILVLFAALGELINQRSGVLNIGLEGIMLMGAIFAVIFSETMANPWYGILSAMFIGGCFGLLHGFISISLKVDQVISGTGIWLLGLGASFVLGTPYVGLVKYPLESSVGEFDLLTILGFLLVPVIWFILSKTAFGLKIKVVGESPSLADTSGINVGRVRYICVIVGGVLAGLSGAYTSLVYTRIWAPMLTMGRGFIALALVFLSLWNPLLILGGCLGFGALWMSSIKYQGVIPGVSPILLRTLPYLATVGSLILLRYVKRVEKPSALGRPYFREE
jgi:simple sugar transport system permease protein